jgi:hypothetical protein
MDRRALQTPRFVRDMVGAVISLVFSVLFIWYSRNTGHSFWVYWAPFFPSGRRTPGWGPRLHGTTSPHDLARAGTAVPVTTAGLARRC